MLRRLLETHANHEYSSIIVESFTELLEKIVDTKGDSLYWGKGQTMILKNENF